MKYTYVLRCSDGKLYVGSSPDLKRRINEHNKGEVLATQTRLPVKLVYYEARLKLADARKREKYFKTGFGRRYLKSILEH